MLFRIPQELLRAYGVTIFVTAVGTVLGLWLTSMAAYVLSSRDFRYRYQVSFFFTSPLFSAEDWCRGTFLIRNTCIFTTASSR